MPHLEYALPAKAGEYSQMKVRVAGLMVACPVTQDNPFDCPLRSVRLRSMRERSLWLESLRPEQLRSFLVQHSECIVRKERENHEPA